MSVQAAIGRIDSIIQLQQQLTDPTAASTASAAAAPAAASTGTGTGAMAAGGGQATFAQMLASAQQPGGATAEPVAATTALPATASSGLPTATSGLPTATSGLAGSALATTSANAPAQVQAMVAKADSLCGLPYRWGGGHGGWGPQSGYDCSGFVSAVLHAGGFLSTPQDTTSMPSAPGMVQGPGQHVTVYDRTGSGESGHVIIQIDGQFYESGGGHGPWGGGGGVSKIGRPSDSYLSTFDTLLHPQGL